MRPYQLRSIHDKLGKFDPVLRNALRLGILLALGIGPYDALRSADDSGINLFILIMGLLLMLAVVTPYALLCYLALPEWHSLPKRASGFLATCAVGHALFLFLNGGLMRLTSEGIVVFVVSVLVPGISAASLYVRVRVIEEYPEWSVQRS